MTQTNSETGKVRQLRRVEQTEQAASEIDDPERERRERVKAARGQLKAERRQTATERLAHVGGQKFAKMRRSELKAELERRGDTEKGSNVDMMGRLAAALEQEAAAEKAGQGVIFGADIDDDIDIADDRTQLLRTASAEERSARRALERETQRLELERQISDTELAAAQAESAMLRGRPQPTLVLPRQASQHVELELRVVGGAWESGDAPPESSGTLRCYADDTLHDIRSLAAKQLPWLGTGYSFVRWAQGRLCKMSDDPDDAHQFRARHFMPRDPLDPGPGLLCVVFGRCYFEGEILTAEETKTSEFKSLAEPQRRLGMGVVEVLRERKIEGGSGEAGKSARFTLLEKYMCGFLNSQGGRIMFGITDAGGVEMVPLVGSPGKRRLTREQEHARANEAKDAVRKLVDGTAMYLSPPVDANLYDVAFVPVVSKPSGHELEPEPEQEQEAVSGGDPLCFVVEVTVRQPDELHRACYFPNQTTWLTWQRKTTSTMRQTEGWARAHLTTLNTGWRQVDGTTPVIDQSYYLAEKAEHFHGREWFMRRVQAALEANTEAAEDDELEGSVGVVIAGSEGAGKTALLGNVLRLGGKAESFSGARLCLLAHHCCRSGDPRSLEPLEFIRGLAVQLAVGYWVPSGRPKFPPPHRRQECKVLSQYYARCLEQDPSVRAALSSEDPAICLENGVLAPLRAFSGPVPPTVHGVSIPCVIVVDSIDEGALVPRTSGAYRAASEPPAWNAKAGAFKAGMIASTDDFPSLGAIHAAEPQQEVPALAQAASSPVPRRVTIPELLSRAIDAGQLPPWLQLVVTVRCDEDEDPGALAGAGALMSQLRRVQLDVEKEPRGSEERRPIWWQDVHMYVGNAIKVGFVGAVDPAISDHLCVLSQGNFLYVSTVLEDIHSERLSWADVTDLQPGVSFLLSRHLSSKLASSPELGLAVEVLMAGSAEAGVPTSVIEEAVKTVLPDGALPAGRLERRLRGIPKLLLTCTKTEDGTRLWRLSHGSIRRWLAGDAQTQLSAAHGHQMLAARLAYRLAVASLRPALAQWLVQPVSPREESPNDDAAGVDPSEVLQLASHIDASEAQAGASYADATHPGQSNGGRGVAVLQALGPPILGARRATTLETALHLAVAQGSESALGACTLLLTAMGSSARASFVDCKDAEGCTALARACRDGHASIARCLLEAQADPAVHDKLRRTAVSHAVANGRHDALALLLEPAQGKPWHARAATVLQLADSKSGSNPRQLATAIGNGTALVIIANAAQALRARVPAQVRSNAGRGGRGRARGASRQRGRGMQRRNSEGRPRR